MFKKAFAHLLVGVLFFSFGTSTFVFSQEVNSERPFKTEELDQMLAPIALFPDEVLSNVLIAATYPLDVVQAARWLNQPPNTKLKGDRLTRALETKEWDPSVKSLTQFPDVLKMMNDKLEWTQKLGDAFLAQQDEVFSRIQYLRQKAEEAGNLKDNQQQRIKRVRNEETNTVYIVIEPIDPAVIYVPLYDPVYVYGPWWYPAYPPYYWPWYPGAYLASGFFWGAGFAVAGSLWGWNYCDWRRGNIHIDANRYNTININRTKIESNVWRHDPGRRGSVPYRDKITAEKFGKSALSKDEFKNGDRGNRGDNGPGNLDNFKDRGGDGIIGADQVRDKLGQGSGNKFKDVPNNFKGRDFNAKDFGNKGGGQGSFTGKGGPNLSTGGRGNAPISKGKVSGGQSSRGTGGAPKISGGSAPKMGGGSFRSGGGSLRSGGGGFSAGGGGSRGGGGFGGGGGGPRGGGFSGGGGGGFKGGGGGGFRGGGGGRGR